MHPGARGLCDTIKIKKSHVVGNREAGVMKCVIGKCGNKMKLNKNHNMEQKMSRTRNKRCSF